jgi:hypothetical protein
MVKNSTQNASSLSVYGNLYPNARKQDKPVKKEKAKVSDLKVYANLSVRPSQASRRPDT